MYRNLIPLLLVVVLFSCGQTETNQKSDVVSEDELGIITASVFSDNTLEKSFSDYPTSIPGESERFERSFENAPPMIPHNTEGFFPITIKNNICLTCRGIISG